MLTHHVMYPKSTNNQSNEYVQDGYEASFGSYEVDEVKQLHRHVAVSCVDQHAFRLRDIARLAFRLWRVHVL